MKKRVIYFGAIILSLIYLIVGNRIACTGIQEFEHIYQDDCEMAKATGIIARQSAAQEIEGVVFGRGVNIIFAAELLTGENKGSLITVIQNCDPDSPFQMREITPGEHILVTLNPEANSTHWIMGEYVRTNTLLVLGIVFAVLLILFGRMKGFNTLLSLTFTCAAIFMVFIPAILSGKNIYFWAITTCGFIIVMTLLIVNGADKKSLCAAAGCFGGVLLSGWLTLFSDKFLQLTGMVDEESLYLKYLLDGKTIDLKAIIFAGILIGAVGAIMDVAISLSSALYEIKVSAPESTFASLTKSGITIGRDMMGTMSNTLVLAYIGGSLSMTLLLIAYSNSTLALLNREMIVVEILQALVGSIGLLLTIPLTTVICAFIYCIEKKQEQPAETETSEQNIVS